MRWHLIPILVLALVINVLNIIDVPWPWLLGLLGVQVGLAISMGVDIARGAA